MHGHMNVKNHVIRTAFPRQQWLCEIASILRSTYIVCLVTSNLYTNLLRLNTTYVRQLINDKCSGLFLLIRDTAPGVQVS
jgi:hypothetical protein